jgi:hypothetical protein
MFEPFKFNGMQYLAVTQRGGSIIIVDFTGHYHGSWENIQHFKSYHRFESPKTTIRATLSANPVLENLHAR